MRMTRGKEGGMKIDGDGNLEKLGYNGNFKFATEDVDWTRKRCQKRRCHYASIRSNLGVFNAYGKRVTERDS
ncbi:hypothetical protein C1H46_012327 [Malus baccata]|uniref:Uncharacterized protein n=1 Tax=Malus baccata TaxID=106549 RepID=A0A540MTA2_MALBA|nr:hypothetical protein C1H46_012327 [Malus baccata]